MSRTSKRPLALAALATALGALAHGDVLVVDADGPPGSFATIQAAVDDAANGDVVLVKEGQYLTFLIDDKALDVVADQGHTVGVHGGVVVRDLSPGKRVLLSGLEVLGVPPTPVPGRGLSLIDNAGSVRVQSCDFTGVSNHFHPENCNGFGDDSGGEGVSVSGSGDVVFSDSRFLGGRGLEQVEDFGCPKFTPGGEGGHGLAVSQSTVALYGCEILGGRGGLGGWGGRGGDGLRSVASAILLSGCTVEGGDGGTGFDFLFGPGGDGGVGLVLFPGTELALQDTLFDGGAGGHSVVFEDGAPGVPLLGETPTLKAGAASGFAMPVPVHEGNTMELEFSGQPFATVFLIVGVGGLDLSLALPEGVLHVLSSLVITGGNLPRTGVQTSFLPLGSLPPALQSVTLAMQPVYVGSQIQLGPPRHQVILDQSF